MVTQHHAIADFAHEKIADMMTKHDDNMMTRLPLVIRPHLRSFRTKLPS